MSITVLCRYIINLAMIISNPSDNAIRDCVSIALNDFVSKVTLLYLDPDQHDEEWTELDEDIFPKIEYFAPKFNGEGLQILYLNSQGNPNINLDLLGFDVVPIYPRNYNGMPKEMMKMSFREGVSYYNIAVGLNKYYLSINIWLEFLKYTDSWYYKIIGREIKVEEKTIYGYLYEFQYDCEHGYWRFISCYEQEYSKANSIGEDD